LGENKKLLPLAFFLNPILVAVISAIPFAILSLEIPVVVNNTANYLAELTIPLALLGIGGVLQFQNRNYSISAAISASLIKVIIMPIIGIITIVGYIIYCICLPNDICKFYYGPGYGSKQSAR